jgi:hypothetical protein
MRGLIQYCWGILFLILFSEQFALSQAFMGRGALIISHISPDYGLAADEFVILFNASSTVVDLGGYELQYYTSTGSPGNAGCTFEQSVTLFPGDHYIVSNRDTIRVGTVALPRDGIFSSGMASGGGQVILRWTETPDSVVYAIAWGTVTNLVAGMSDAASWKGDGMLSLPWQDSVYIRTGHTRFNAEYEHTPADSIMFLPSLGGAIAGPASADWGLPLTVIQSGSIDSSLFLGMHEDASDAFDTLHDLPTPPRSADNRLTVGVWRTDLQLATGAYLTRDIRKARDLSDTASVWYVDIFSLDPGFPASLSFSREGLSPRIPIQIFDYSSANWSVHTGDSIHYSFSPGTDEPHRFRITVGDTTAPSVRLRNFFQDTSFIVSSRIQLFLESIEKSGIESLNVEFIVAADSSFATTVYKGEWKNDIDWTLPSGLLTSRAFFRTTVTDSAGNYGVTDSPFLSIVPDTFSAEMDKGWHLMSVPFDPHTKSIRDFAPGAREDSLFIFTYHTVGGYRLADTLAGGRGYFWGSLKSRSVRFAGIPVIDSFSIALPVGFSLIGNPLLHGIPLDDVTIRHNGTPYQYDEAVRNGILADGVFGFNPTSGMYVHSDSLKPWKGYWLPVLLPSVSVEYPGYTSPSAERRNMQTPEGWQLRLKGMTLGVTDSLMIVGVHPDAHTGFDAAFDTPAPPPPPDELKIRIVAEHPEWNVPLGNAFLRDFREVGKMAEWVVAVYTPEDGTVRLEWGGSMGKVPHGLVIREQGSSGPDMALNEEWTYAYHGYGVKRFSIRSPATSVEQAGAIPESFRVVQNYPNPFNGSTTFMYEIPQTGFLRVKIFDVVGRVVDRATWKEHDAGVYTYTWSAHASSGAYFGMFEFHTTAEPRNIKRSVIRIILMR